MSNSDRQTRRAFPDELTPTQKLAPPLPGDWENGAGKTAKEVAQVALGTNTCSSSGMQFGNQDA